MVFSKEDITTTERLHCYSFS